MEDTSGGVRCALGASVFGVFCVDGPLSASSTCFSGVLKGDLKGLERVSDARRRRLLAGVAI